ncbi:hypothetical protein TH606_10930 [Thermodesulfatator autotrophicus]|uniref:Uncharacterized protein n=1 Tax=Thermodesulfatator autotrophicus TaxID=1795632 RepID=A0A177E408_9BACT|nr:hypothetical protein TH606_10930 [Thermodesulfatator autotrophicus]
MQNFVVDNLNREEIAKLEKVLQEKTRPSPIGGLYWIEIPENILAPIQLKHKECGPHYFAVEIGENFISFEFLVRNFKSMRCECIAPATPAQKIFLLEKAKEIFTLAGVPFHRG